MFGDTVPSELPDKWAMSIRQPIGVAGIITPWNFPMAIPCWKMMPALVDRQHRRVQAGHRHAALRDAARRADGRGGLPAGRRQPRHRLRRRGRRRASSTARTSPVISLHRQRRRPGKRIAERGRPAAQAAVASSSAARTAIVVLADADLDLAVDGHPLVGLRHDRPALHGLQPGHRRARRSPTRSLAAPRGAGRGRSGSAPGCDATTDVGPLINAARRRQGRRLRRGRARARASWSAAAGGATGGGLEHGHFFEPTIFTRRRARWTGSPRRRSSARCSRSSRCRTTTRR